MTKKFDNSNRGALFNNRADKKSDEDRDYAGTINIEGIDYWLSGWIKHSKKGQKYVALAVKMKEAKNNTDDDVGF
jgi:hypothetical protein